MDETLKNNLYRILERFIEFPIKDFSIRGMARELNLNHATIINYIKDLQRLDLIKKKDSTLYPTYFANTESQKYKFYKRNWLVFRILDSGLVDYIQKETLASSIILFGSGAKATLNEKSDVDIFIEAKEVSLEVNKFEKKLGYKVSLLFEKNVNDLSKELRNNIVNGVILYGFVRVDNGK